MKYVILRFLDIPSGKEFNVNVPFNPDSIIENIQHYINGETVMLTDIEKVGD